MDQDSAPVHPRFQFAQIMKRCLKFSFFGPGLVFERTQNAMDITWTFRWNDIWNFNIFHRRTWFDERSSANGHYRPPTSCILNFPVISWLRFLIPLILCNYLWIWIFSDKILPNLSPIVLAMFSKSCWKLSSKNNFYFDHNGRFGCKAILNF